MQKMRKAVLILALTVPFLGGCQSIFGGSHGSRAELRVPEAPDPAEYAAAQMAAGTAALDDKQYGLAIRAFRHAKLSPEHAAAAYNGLAIAYSHLGRHDLTERYFRHAIEIDPANKRYQANLSRFYRVTPVAAVRPAKSESLAAVGKARENAADTANVRLLGGNGNNAGFTIESPVSRMVRISPREVVIGAAAPGSSDPRRRASPARAAVAVGEPVRRRNPYYPVKVTLPPETPAVATSSSARMANANYPIRVTLTPAK